MRKVKVAIAIVVGVGLLLGLIAHHPVAFCDRELPEQYMDAVQDQAKGLYSQSLPLVPVFVNVESFQKESVHYTIYYFPFGAVGMSYDPADGYNIEKPLTRM